MLNLKISNADENVLRAIEAILKLAPNASLEVENASIYPQLEAQILNDLQEIKQKKQKGELDTYESALAAFKAQGLV